MNLRVGDRVIVDHELFGSLTFQVLRYIVVLMRRLSARYDAPLRAGVAHWADQVYPLTEKQQ